MKYKFLCNALLATSGFLGTNIVGSDLAELPSSLANASEAEILTETGETSAAQNSNPTGLSQVTSVSQLRDVLPTDWSFQALQSLVERYGCIAGYPNGSYRGNRPLTRWEFAAGLNACLDRINELIAAATTRTITRADLITLQRLQQEFAAELATLRGRVEVLEARTAELETNQFSTTTKLEGEVVFSTGAAFGDRKASRDGSRDENVNENWVWGYRARLNFVTTFADRSRLQTRLDAGNLNSFSEPTGTDMASLGFEANTENEIKLGKLTYTIPVAKEKILVWLGAVDLATDEIHPPLLPLSSAEFGVISNFGRFNPVYRLPANTGGGIAVNFGKGFQVTGSYMTNTPTGIDPTDGNGLFNGTYTAMGQLTYQGEAIQLAVNYARTFMTPEDVNLTGNTGSENAQDPFNSVATSANVLGVQGNVRLSRGLILSGWFGWWDAIEEGGDSHAGIYSWAGTVAFPDLFAEGNLGGIVVGMPPKVVSGANRNDNGTALHIEAVYRIRVNDNISITPGVFVILNPEHHDENDTIYVGNIRTVFQF